MLLTNVLVGLVVAVGLVGIIVPLLPGSGLVAAALVSAWLITGANVPAQLAGVLAPFMDSPKLLMLMMMLLVVVVRVRLDSSLLLLLFTDTGSHGPVVSFSLYLLSVCIA